MQGASRLAFSLSLVLVLMCSLHVLLRELDVHARMSALSMRLNSPITRYTNSFVMIGAVHGQCEPRVLLFVRLNAYYAIHALLCDGRCSCTVQALTLHQRHFQRQRRASDAPDSAISTSHILHGVVRITNGVRCITWQEFCCQTFGSVLRTSFLILWWQRVLPKELDEKVAKLQFSRTQYGVGNSVVHKLMDAMSSALKLRDQMAHAEVRRQCGADPAGGKIHAGSL